MLFLCLEESERMNEWDNGRKEHFVRTRLSDVTTPGNYGLRTKTTILKNTVTIEHLQNKEKAVSISGQKS